MHSYLQRHLRTHNSAGGATCVKDAGKITGKGGTSETMATTLSLNMNAVGGLSSLFPTDGNSTLILSPPNLDIPPNTSQNYFMIQTPMGLQLIPLSNPVPTQPVPPPPPPPPPIQPPSQNFLLLQCQSTNGNQPSLILVPTATNTNALSAPSAPQPLPLVQTIPALPQVLAAPQTQISQFQPLQPQQRFILTNNTPLITAPPQNTTAINRPILGTLGRTRNARTRRGRKPKAKTLTSGSLVQTTPAPATQTSASSTTSTATTSAAPVTPARSSQELNIQVLTSVPPQNSDPVPETHSSPVTVTPTESASSNSLCASAGEAQSAPATDKLSEPISGEHFVLCFEKQAGERQPGEGMQVKVEMEEGVEEGRSYVLQFEGEGEQGQGGSREGGEKSYVLRFQAEGENEGAGAKEKTGMVSLNLLQDWGEERGGERIDGIEGGVGVGEKSFVLHFQTEPQSDDDIQPNSGYAEGQHEDLGLSCHSAQALMPLRGQEVVFELANDAKIDGDAGAGQSVQMIALIEGEGSSSEGGDAFADPTAVVGTGAGQMEGIFQLEGGEGIVIIEVSTSSLREGGEGGVSLGLRNMEKEVTAAQEVMTEEQKILEAKSRLSSAGMNGAEG